MKDKGIDLGLVQEFETSDKRNKGNKWGWRKMFWTYLNKLNVPFYDSCCTDAPNGQLPVAIDNRTLKYFDGTDWVAVDMVALTQPTTYGVQQDLSGAGAISVATYYTAWTTTAADAGTLADGDLGQLKKITLVVDGGDGTLTPANLSGGTTITFDTAGDYVVLYFNGTDWVVTENSGTTIA